MGIALFWVAEPDHALSQWKQWRSLKSIMLAGFFDDSGTHSASRVAVWGGLCGPIGEFEKLDVAWRALLASPIDDMPQLSKFSLAHCIAGEGEFAHYNKAQRDHVRYRFRHLLDDIDVAPIACAVDASAWNSLISEQTRSFLGDPHLKAFDGCLEQACGFASNQRERLSLYFDAGQLDRSIRAVLAACEIKMPNEFANASVTFSPVAELTGLQAADLIAGEAYRYFGRMQSGQIAEAEPHFRDLIDNAGAIFLYYGKEEIERLFSDFEREIGPFMEALMSACAK